MATSYKMKIIKEIEKVPDEKLGNIYKIIHLLTSELTHETKKSGKRMSLKGIWKGSQIDDSIFSDARKSVFPYERKKNN
jgi:hypothetical protein